MANKPNVMDYDNHDIGGGIPFEIVSPDEVLLSEPVDMAEIPGSEGYFAVLPGHTPLITTLQPGVITLYRNNDVVWQIYVSGGVCEVNFEKCTILAQRAYDLPQIDIGSVKQEIETLRSLMQREEPYGYQAQKMTAQTAEAEARLAAAQSQFAAKTAA